MWLATSFNWNIQQIIHGNQVVYDEIRWNNVLDATLAHWENGKEGRWVFIPSLPIFPGRKFFLGGNCLGKCRLLSTTGLLLINYVYGWGMIINYVSKLGIPIPGRELPPGREDFSVWEGIANAGWTWDLLKIIANILIRWSNCLFQKL